MSISGGFSASSDTGSARLDCAGRNPRVGGLFRVPTGRSAIARREST